MAEQKSTGGGGTGSGGEHRGWGITDVTIRYVSGNDTWEVSLDPHEIDILVFNWKRFEEISRVVGRPPAREHHLRPDGTPAHGGGTPAETARRVGFRGPPRRVGPRQEGTTYEPGCVHNRTCQWWCIDENHAHELP
jgi:hypothetical protein